MCLSDYAKSKNVVTISRITLFSHSITTITLNCIDIAVLDLCNNTDMIWISIRLPVKEDNHTGKDDLVIVGTIYFGTVNPLIMGLEPVNTI